MADRANTRIITRAGKKVQQRQVRAGGKMVWQDVKPFDPLAAVGASEGLPASKNYVAKTAAKSGTTGLLGPKTLSNLASDKTARTKPATDATGRSTAKPNNKTITVPSASANTTTGTPFSTVPFDQDPTSGNATYAGSFHNPDIPVAGTAALFGLHQTMHTLPRDNIHGGDEPSRNIHYRAGNSTIDAATGKKVAGSTQDLTPDKALKMFANMDPRERANIEYLMYQSGYYAGKKFIPGAPASDDDISAFQKLLAQTQTTGVPIDQFLTNSAKQAQLTGQTPDQQAASLLRSKANNVATTNPIDAAQSLKTAFAAALGREPTARETATFTASYHAAEVSAGYAAQGLDAQGNPIGGVTNQYNTTNPVAPQGFSVTGGGEHGGASIVPNYNPTLNPNAPGGLTAGGAGAGATTSVAAPTLGAAATQYAQTTDPVGYDATQLGMNADNIFKALISSNAGNITTTPL